MIAKDESDMSPKNKYSQFSKVGSRKVLKFLKSVENIKIETSDKNRNS